jgi:hypothetical protein
MSVVDKKQKIFGNIAAARTITEGMPKFKKNSSFPSINNKGNSITFLTDLIKALIGYIALVKAIVDILTHQLAKIEKDIKKALKTELKAIVSCGVDPSLPSFIKSTGTGIVIEVKKVDFLQLFKIDAKTKVGALLYNDVTPVLTDSTDLNTFLYGVIQDDGVMHTWKDKNGNGLFDITFKSTGTAGIPNNTFTIKANSSYNTKTLNDLNNNFVDSLTLFNSENIVSRIIDIIFGSISFTVKKPRFHLEMEEKINKIVDKMVDEDANAKESDSGDDDTFFTFNNDELSVIESRSDERQRGVIKIKTSTEIDGVVPVETLTAFTQSMSVASTTEQKKAALSNSLDQMANESARDVKLIKDKGSVKLNFIQLLITNLIKAIVGIVLSPKIVMIFLINYKIIYGPTATYGDAIDFIKKNKKLFKQIMKRIAGMIIKILLAIALQKIAKLVGDAMIEKNIEKNKNKKTQLLSLVGVPQEALRAIKGLM